MICDGFPHDSVTPSNSNFGWLAKVHIISIRYFSTCTGSPTPKLLRCRCSEVHGSYFRFRWKHTRDFE
jgi:hypothetical protein